MSEVLPQDIDTDQHLWGAFEHMETEASAIWIVRLLQSENVWRPFTLAELQAFYEKGRGRQEQYLFNRLIHPGRSVRATEEGLETIWKGGGWVAEMPDGTYTVTKEFVRRCYESSPRKKES